MKYNEAVRILEEVSNYKANMVTDNSNSKWNRLNTHWEDNGYYTEWGHIFGGTDNEEESREELIIYIKPTNYPHIEEEDAYDDLTEFYQDTYDEDEFSESDIAKIHVGTYHFKDYEVGVEWRDWNSITCDWNSLTCESHWIREASDIYNIIENFLNSTEEYHIEYTRGN